MVGYSPEELMQLKIENITPPEYVEEDLRQKQRLISGEASAVQREKAYIRKNGSRVSVRVMVAPLPAADGAPQYLILVVEEIRGLETASSELAP
jgi:PAS domain S-box-containing protein